MVLNVVLHRLNIDHVEEILEMALLKLGADYVELANIYKYYGWAWHNREHHPSLAQVQRAEQVMKRFRGTRSGAGWGSVLVFTIISRPAPRPA